MKNCISECDYMSSFLLHFSVFSLPLIHYLSARLTNATDMLGWGGLTQEKLVVLEENQCQILGQERWYKSPVFNPVNPLLCETLDASVLLGHIGVVEYR